MLVYLGPQPGRPAPIDPLPSPLESQSGILLVWNFPARATPITPLVVLPVPRGDRTVLAPRPPPLSQDLPPQGEGGGRVRRTHAHSPPAPSSTPSLQQHAPPPPNAPQGRQNGEGGEDTGQGERDEPRRLTGQGRLHSPKTVQSAEGEEGKEKRERIIVVVRSPCRENYPADEHPSAQVSAGVGKSSMDSECASGCTWSTARATARLRDSQPWSSQTGQVIQGLR